MNPSSRTFPWYVGLGLLMLVLCVALAFVSAGLNSRVARAARPPVYGNVEDFALTDQTGSAVTLADLRGRVWIADVIFTRCAGPCLRMSRQMGELQAALPQDSRARLVSLTTDPDYDTPAVLARYAERFGANPHRWIFLTGAKKQVRALATGSLKLSVVDKTPGEQASADDLFVHSTIFVAVDKAGRLRGVFETGGDGANWPLEKGNILRTVRQLERER